MRGNFKKNFNYKHFIPNQPLSILLGKIIILKNKIIPTAHPFPKLAFLNNETSVITLPGTKGQMI